MRFKRVRWAAMEFLLKSQKRNRRKLIIEQLILLALRCLLVLLVGLLLGRLRLGGDTGQNAFHFVVLDDTPSMGDHFVENGKVSNSFDVAKDQLKLLADTIAQASTRQQMRVVLLSDLDDVIFDQQLNNGAGDELAAKLQDKQPAAIHVDPILAVEKARTVFSTLPRGKKVFHFVSDFRDRDWKTGPDAETLGQGRGRPDGHRRPRQLYRHGPSLPRRLRGRHRPARQSRHRRPQAGDDHRGRGRAGRVHRRRP